MYKLASVDIEMTLVLGGSTVVFRLPQKDESLGVDCIGDTREFVAYVCGDRSENIYQVLCGIVSH